MSDPVLEPSTALPLTPLAPLLSETGIFSRFPEAVLLFSQAGKPVAANPAGQRLIDRTRDGALPALEALVATARTSGKIEIGLVQIDDARQSTVIEMSVLPDTTGAFLVIGRDATLELTLREALVESRQRFKDLVEISSDFAWETNSDGAFVYVSPHGALGWAAQQLVGQTPDILIPEGTATCTTASTQTLPFNATATVEDVEILLQRADGSAAHLIVSGTPLYDANGEYRGTRGVCRDISVERQRDADLAATQERLKVINRLARDNCRNLQPVRILSTAAQLTMYLLGASGCCLLQPFSDPAETGYRILAWVGEGPDLGPDPVSLSLGTESLGTERAEGAPSPGGATKPDLGVVHRIDRDPYRGLAIDTAYAPRDESGLVIAWRTESEPPWSLQDHKILKEMAVHIRLTLRQIRSPGDAAQPGNAEPGLAEAK